MQERLLASRMLHFGEGHLFWECAELRRVPEWSPHQHPYYPWDLRDYIGPGDLCNIEILGAEELRSWRWPAILRHYSRSGLTYPDKDKLVALEGVGKRVAELLNDKYCNGYMQKDLPHALCWEYQLQRHGRKPPYVGFRSFQMPQQLRAPSWHWSSTDHELSPHQSRNICRDCPLIWLLPSHGPLARQLRHDTTLLCLGRAFPVYYYDKFPWEGVLRLPDQQNVHQPLDDKDNPFISDYKDLATVMKDDLSSLSIMPVTAGKRNNRCLRVDPEWQVRRKLFAHLMGRTEPLEYSKRSVIPELTIDALVLLEVEKGVFVRVGTFAAHREQEILMMVDAMRRAAPRLIAIR